MKPQPRQREAASQVRRWHRVLVTLTALCLAAVCFGIAMTIAKADEAKEQPRIANLPVNRLLRGYQLYAHVKFCKVAREGYLVQYVTDAEMARAEKAIRSIATQATKDDTTINTDDVWKQAAKTLHDKEASVSFCQQSLAQLLNRRPLR